MCVVLFDYILYMCARARVQGWNQDIHGGCGVGGRIVEKNILEGGHCKNLLWIFINLKGFFGN